MLIAKKHQMFLKLDTTEGVVTAIGSESAFLALAPGVRVEKEMIDRNASAPTLSKENDNVGRGSIMYSFGVDIRGSGTATTRPAWDRIVRSCGFRERPCAWELAIGAVTNGPFVEGEIVTQATSGATGRVRWVTPTGASHLYLEAISGSFNGTNGLTGGTSGATATPSAATFKGWTILTIGAITSGPFTAGSTVTGGTSSATGVVIGTTTTGATRLFLRDVVGEFASAGETITSGGTSAVVPAAGVINRGFAYHPDSTTASAFDTGANAWTGTAALGEVIGNVAGARGYLRGGVVGNGLKPGRLWIEMVAGTGSFANGDTLICPVSGAFIALHTTTGERMDRRPCASITSIVDGFSRLAFGNRGNLRIAMQAGAPGRFDCEYKGPFSTHGDSPLFPNVTYESTNPLVFAAAVLRVDNVRYPVSRFEINLQNILTMRADANATRGDMSCAIAGRDPVMSLDPEMVLAGVFDWYAKWQNATNFNVVAEIGSTPGNRLFFFMPALQIESVADGEREQILTSDVVAKLRRATTSGDDELWIFHT